MLSVCIRRPDKKPWCTLLAAGMGRNAASWRRKVWDYSGPIGERDVGKVLKVRGSVSARKI